MVGAAVVVAIRSVLVVLRMTPFAPVLGKLFTSVALLFSDTVANRCNAHHNLWA